MTREEFHALALALPGVVEGASYGEPSLKLNGKFFTRVRREEGAAVLQDVPHEERDALIEAEQAVFFYTAHSRNYPIVLARLEAATTEHVRGLLERSWRRRAPKRMLTTSHGA